MISLQLHFALLCAAVSVSSAATCRLVEHVDLSNERARVCTQQAPQGSTCRKGAVHEGKEHEEEDDASLLQVKISSEGPEQSQASSLEEFGGTEFGSAEDVNASSEAKPQESVELEQELLALTQAGSLDSGGVATNLTETAGRDAMKQLSLKLLETTESGAMLDLGAARTASSVVTILIVLMLVCLLCAVAMIMGGSPKDVPDGARPEDTSGIQARSPQPPSGFPTSNPLLSSTMRAKASSRGSPPSQSRAQPHQGSTDMLESRPGTAASRPGSNLSLVSQTSPGAPGMPLCPSLIIPDGTRLACVIQNDLRRTKQSLAFDVRSVVSRGGASLFRIHVNELNDQTPGVSVETLDGSEQLAFLSTEHLWVESSTSSHAPLLSIYRPKGALYGTVQKNSNGDYQVLRGQTSLMTISGDFAQHKIEITAASGRAVAATQQTSPEEYMVNVQSRIDAGLVVLALLGVDKCEAMGS
mmetsp:Transcript_33046/g.58753  ORF Transcript_33046/g.58753 Transcript_33046/m.58753 type:complete len:471 (-) Transcript_33046:93-1505(-)